MSLDAPKDYGLKSLEEIRGLIRDGRLRVGDRFAPENTAHHTPEVVYEVEDNHICSVLDRRGGYEEGDKVGQRMYFSNNPAVGMGLHPLGSRDHHRLLTQEVSTK